jgi:hypothetical protein
MAGACPSQYFILLDRLRAEGIDAPVVMVIYIGNDLFDEGLWASLGEDKSGYLAARGKALNDPTTPEFWPCLDGRRTLGGWFSDHSALYRALFFAKYKVESRFSKPKPEQTQDEKFLIEMMDAKCDKPPHSERIKGRLFFFREHEAQLDLSDPLVREGRERVARLIQTRCREKNLTIVLALTREENSVAFTGRVVTPAAPFIDEMRKTCPDIIDPNPAFAAAAAERDLYLPDAHWNTAGGRLMADRINGDSHLFRSNENKSK